MRTSAQTIPAGKTNKSLTIGWAVIAWLALGASGCAVEHETAAEDVESNLESLVDAQVLENISKLEGELVGSALRHEGRIWYSPALVTTFLTTQDGESGMAFTLGNGRDYAALESPPPIGEGAPLWDVLAQQAVEPTHVFSSESGVDIVLFDVEPQTESGFGQTTEALAGPQSCPTTFFPQTCNPDNHLQYQGSALNVALADNDRGVNTAASSSNLVSSTIAVCSEVGGARLVVTTSNPAWGTAPGGTGVGGLTIGEGYIGVWANFGTWRERRFCARKVLGVCVDHNYRIQYQDFDVAFSITKLNVVSEYSYCANFYTKGEDINDDACNVFFCPVIGFGG